MGLTFGWFNLEPAHMKRLEDFTASKGFLVSFVKRHAFRNVKLSCGASSVNAATIAQDMINLCKPLEQYKLSCTLNMDETGLFNKLFPRQTYICKHENRQSVRGTKGMKAKERKTGYVCKNAAGVKVSMCIIGKPKTPRCFFFKKPPVPCFSQRSAWSYTTTFKA